MKKVEKSDVLPPTHKTADKLAHKLISADSKAYIKIQKDAENERLRNLQDCSTVIKSCVSRLARTFVEIGYHLWLCRENQYFLAAGYSDIFDYAFKEFGFKRSSVYNFIDVCKRFSVRIDDLPSYMVLDSYKQYSFSQLCELLNLSDKQIQTAEISADDSVRKIKEKKKKLREMVQEYSDSLVQQDDSLLISVPSPQTNSESVPHNITITETKKISVDFTEEQAELLLNILDHTCFDDVTDYRLVDALRVLRSKLMEAGDKVAV